MTRRRKSNNSSSSQSSGQSSSGQSSNRQRSPRNSRQQSSNPSKESPNAAKEGSGKNRQWFKVDLHLHSPGSKDYEQPEISYLDMLRRAVEQELDAIAITDHNTVSGVAAIRKEIEWLTRLEKDNRLTKEERARLDEWRSLTEKVTIFPGFEFTATFGFHILGIFPPETTVRQLEHVLLLLNVPTDKLDEGSTETGANADVLTAYRAIHEAGGLAIAAHANSTHGVAMRDFPFGGQTKIAYTQDPNLDALEVTDWERRGRSTPRFFNGSKAEYPRRMHCIQGSDAHRLEINPQKPKRLGIGERSTEMLLEEMSFNAIAALLRSDEFDRVRPARPKDKPFDPVAAAREEGPGITLSFHESASQRGGRLTAILADVCAFANTMGGTVYVGVHHRKPKIKGLPDVKETQQEIQSALDERLTPPLDVKCTIQKTENVNLLCLKVPKGTDRPYCLDDYKFYLREESDTSQAVRDEIVALVGEVLDSKQRTNRNNRRNDSNKPRSNNSGGKGGAQSNGQAGGSQNNGSDSSSGSDNNGQGNEPEKDAFYLPQVGVEIIESNQRNGYAVHSIRDMRNGRIIKNVTRKRSRKLWNYAIQQREDHPVDAGKVQWQGNVGLVSATKRAGKMRYDLALRDNGEIRVFYGVTEDGMEGTWSKFVKDEE